MYELNGVLGQLKRDKKTEETKKIQEKEGKGRRFQTANFWLINSIFTLHQIDISSTFTTIL